MGTTRTTQAYDGEQVGRGPLTDRELQVLELVSYGYANGAIASHFQITLQAIKNTLRTAHLKLGADNRAHAVSICFRNGWLPAKSNSGGHPDIRTAFRVRTPSGFLATHRWNQDGTIDSLCDACGLEIARALIPADLAVAESKHVCQIFERRHTIRIVSRDGVSVDAESSSSALRRDSGSPSDS